VQTAYIEPLHYTLIYYLTLLGPKLAQQNKRKWILDTGIVQEIEAYFNPKNSFWLATKRRKT
jgi:hypothetical protein